MLLAVLVLMGQREGLDLGLESMGPAIDHEGLDTGGYQSGYGARTERYATYGTAPATYASGL